MDKKGIIKFKNQLNPTQLKAVQSTEGPHLVIAGAGSGKTRILVYRVAHLVDMGVDPQKILLLTFTRRAAEEMLTRASATLDKRCHSVSGGTFHSFANMVLRRYAPHVGLTRNFSIMDQGDAQSAVNLVRTRLGFNKFDKRFPKKRALLNIISKSVNVGDDIELVIEAEYPHFLIYAEDIKRIKRKYIEHKREKGLLDYDDLLIYLKELLSKNKDICSKLSNKYSYIMVDEYQDTNKLQAEILYLLLKEHNNIMVVGDDSQSIYSFRGGKFQEYNRFPKAFQGYQDNYIRGELQVSAAHTGPYKQGDRRCFREI